MENTDIYRVTGGRVMNLIRMHIGATRSAEKAIRAIIKKLGASKVTLTHEGKIDYFEFESQPSRSVWKGSKYCARPKASTTAGRQLQQQLDEVASKPTWGDFTKALTGEPHLFLHIDDDMRAGAYWGTVRFGTPDEKTDIWFLFVDREPGKVAKFVPPSDGCTLLKLSEYHAILESVSKPTAASRFSHDDRGNVVDFYDTETDEQIARLDREAEVNGKTDQYAWDNWAGGDELEAYARENGFGDAIDEARRLESAGKQ